MTNRKQEAFLTTAVGKLFNPDNFAGYQCKDLPDAYCIHLFGDWINTIRPGNGKDVFANANPAYFTKVRNNPADPRQVPPRGSILSYAGTAAVPEGHTALTLEPRPGNVLVLQMDGYRQVPAHTFTLPYTGLIGWLIPKVPADPKPRPPAPKPRPKPAARPANPPRLIRVEAGDNLTAIAAQFRTTVPHLIRMNGIKNPNMIRPGQLLRY